MQFLDPLDADHTSVITQQTPGWSMEKHASTVENVYLQLVGVDS